MTKKELAKFLYDNFYVEGGNFIDLTDLDFTEFECDVSTSYMKVLGVLAQDHQTVGMHLSQNYQTVHGNIEQDNQKAGGEIYQEDQEFEVIYQDEFY